MPKCPWLANSAVFDLMEEVKFKYHSPRLELAKVAVCFADSKPFVKGRFNWGKTLKFSPLNKLFQQHNKIYDFLIILSTDAWHEVLTGDEREALLDLHLTRCVAEFLPNFIEENGKKKPIKDKWGRVEYSSDMKLDEEGNPIWKVLPLDLPVFGANVRRYGIWCEDLATFKEAVDLGLTKEKEGIDFMPQNGFSVNSGGGGFSPGYRGMLIPNADCSFTANYSEEERAAMALAGKEKEIASSFEIPESDDHN